MLFVPFVALPSSWLHDLEFAGKAEARYGAVVHAFREGRWRLERSGIGGSDPVDECCGIFRRVAVEDEAVITNVDVMWLLGRLVPNHKTIAEFGEDDGRAIREMCALRRAVLRDGSARNGDRCKSILETYVGNA